MTGLFFLVCFYTEPDMDQTLIIIAVPHANITRAVEEEVVAMEPANFDSDDICGCHNHTLPRILFPLAATTRNLKKVPKTIHDLPLVKYALTSIIDTLEPDLFDYGIYVGADKGDAWLDRPLHIHAIQEWFIKYYHKKWGAEACVPALLFYAYDNTRYRNVWVINYVTQLGYERGYDYFYQINDDTILSNDQWSTHFTDVLTNAHPIPGLGVVGPWDPVQKGILMTHSCISRVHLHVFGVFFNFGYGNTYSDVWIQEVYAKPYPVKWLLVNNTSLSTILPNVRVKHVVLKTRYISRGTPAVHKQQIEIDRVNFHEYVNFQLSQK
jgi:hypothetical protein